MHFVFCRAMLANVNIKTKQKAKNPGCFIQTGAGTKPNQTASLSTKYGVPGTKTEKIL